MQLVFGTYLIVTFGFLLFASCVRLLWLHICVMLDLIHQLFLMLSRMVNGGALGEGPTEFPECVVNHVRALFPSTTDN